MSVDLHVVVARDRVPTTRAWNVAIRDAGYALSLDETCVLGTSGGFWPCTFEGTPSGFESYAGDVADLPKEIRREGAVFIFRTHSDMREGACSVISAATLCAMRDGMLWDPQTDETVTAFGLGALEWAREVVAEMRPYFRDREG
jgi:hypothetical protein